MESKLWICPSEEKLLLVALLRRREEYINTRMQEKNRKSSEQSSAMVEDIEKHIKFLDKQIERLETQINEILQNDKELSQKSELIQGVKGFGKVSAMSLIVYLPELGTLSRGGVAALVGVAPYNRDSGQKTGKRMIRGGRKILRDKLYMLTLQAMRTNEVIKKYHERLTAKGKPFKVSLIACMRKLLIHINAKIRNNIY